MKVVTVKIKSELLEELDTYAIKNQLNRSEAIREAIKLLLQSRHKKEETIPNDNYINGELKVVTFKIEDDVLEELDTYAIKNQLNRSEAIRKAIQLWIWINREKEAVPKAKVERFKLF